MPTSDPVTAFCGRVRAAGVVWTARSSTGVHAVLGADELRRIPFWSSRELLTPLLTPAGPLPAGLRPYRLDLLTWRAEWLPRLERDWVLIGLDWSGRGLRGCDVPAARVLRALHQPELAAGAWP